MKTKTNRKKTSKRAANPLRSPDPRLQRLADRSAKMFELAVEKVMAHQSEPGKYPLPPGEHTLERIFKRLFDELPPDQRKRATRQMAPRLCAAGKQRRETYGDLTGVDLRLPVSVTDQVKNLPTPKGMLLSEKVCAEIEQNLAKFLIPKPVPGPTPVAVGLESRLIRVKCIKDTIEVGWDEMKIAGTATDDQINFTFIPVVDLGKFKTGTELEFPSPDRKQFFLYDLTQGDFPKAFVTTFVLAEIDRDRLAGFMLLIAGILGPLAYAGFVTGLATGFWPLTLICGLATLAIAVAEIVAFLLLDDVFNQVFFSTAVLASNAATFPDGEETTELETFRFSAFGGTYEVETDYRLLTEV